MKLDSIFRIASMTKPIVSGWRNDAGRGRQSFFLLIRYSKYLPELKEPEGRCGKKDAAGNAVLEEVAAVREMTDTGFFYVTHRVHLWHFRKITPLNNDMWIRMWTMIGIRRIPNMLDVSRNYPWHINRERPGSTAALPMFWGPFIERVTGRKRSMYFYPKNPETAWHERHWILG